MRKSFKKGLAMVLAAAMVFSTPVAVDRTVSAAAEEESSVETLTGTAWWTGSQAGKDYAINKGNKTVLYVMAQTGGDFSVEVKGENKYLTTGSDQNGWTAEDAAGQGTVSGVNWVEGAADNSIVVAGHLYKITVDRTGEDITVEYYDVTTDTSRCTIRWTGGNMPDEAGVHVIAQVGTFVVTTNEPKVATMISGITPELNEDGTKIDIAYTKELPLDGLSVTVSGSAVKVEEDITENLAVTGSAVYSCPVDGDGEYKITFTASKSAADGFYLDDVKTASITLVKVGDVMYMVDKTLITKELSVVEKENTYTISWENVAGATAKAVVTGPDGKVVKELTAPGSVTATATGNYNIALTVTKGNKIATVESAFSYTKPSPKTDKFSKVTSATPIFKSTFDTADSAKNDGATLSAKASVKDGVLVLAPDTKQKGQYYAQLPSFASKDFSKGITFIADVNVAAWEVTWTPFVVFGDGTPASDASTATFRWAFDVGFDSIAGTKETTVSGQPDGWHTAGGAVGYYGNDSTAPMATGYSYDFFSKAENQKKWYTVAVTVNKTDMTTYVNGVQIQTKKGDFTKLFDGMKKASKNYLGTSYWTGDPDLAGSMDDVAVYNTALSAADIKTLTRTDAAGNGGGQTVTTPTAKVSKVTIKVPNKKSGKTIYMKVKDKLTLKATVKGTGKYSKSVTWKSSKKKVASVTSKGKVTAKKAGTAKITATSKTDKKKKATITIKVSKKAVKNKTLKLKATKKTLKKGKTYTIGIKKITKKTTEKVTYKTSKKSVATVDAYGVVKAKKKGTAKITVKCGKKKATLKLTVKK